jgi:hypothetical protein
MPADEPAEAQISGAEKQLRGRLGVTPLEIARLTGMVAQSYSR